MIYCECKPDEVLIKVLINKKPKHGDNKSEICKRLENEKDKIALLDKDPTSSQPPYLKNLSKINNYSDLKLEICYDSVRNNKIILLNPRLEDWILRVAKNVGVNPIDFDLPKNPKSLHKEINSKLDNFRRFLKKLLQESPKELQILRKELESKN